MACLSQFQSEIDAHLLFGKQKSWKLIMVKFSNLKWYGVWALKIIFWHKWDLVLEKIVIFLRSRPKQDGLFHACWFEKVNASSFQRILQCTYSENSYISVFRKDTIYSNVWYCDSSKLYHLCWWVKNCV